MPSEMTMDDTSYKAFLAKLSDFQEVGVKAPMARAAKQISDNLKKNIKDGRGFGGDKYENVKDPQTHLMPIAFSGPFTDTRKRIDVTGNPTPFNVTGQTLEAINVSVQSNKEVNVGYDDARTALVLQGNARASGNVDKPKRDPVGHSQGIPSDFEFDAVADALEAELDRILDGR